MPQLPLEFFTSRSGTIEKDRPGLNSPQPDSPSPLPLWSLAPELTPQWGRGESTLERLLERVLDTCSLQEQTLARCQAIAILGQWRVEQATAAIATCLRDENETVVDWAVWALGELGCQEPQILDTMTQLLDLPRQNYRVLLQTLARLKVWAAIPQIRQLLQAEEPTTVSGALAALHQLDPTGYSIAPLLPLLQNPQDRVRRAALRDLADLGEAQALPAMAACPVAPRFRLASVRALADHGFGTGRITFAEVEPWIDAILVDRYDTLTLVHADETTPDKTTLDNTNSAVSAEEVDHADTLEQLWAELQQQDFARGYLASQTLVRDYAEPVRQTFPDRLLVLWSQLNDTASQTTALYHLLKVGDRLNCPGCYPMFLDILRTAQPQLLQVRVAAAIALSQPQTIDPDQYLPILRQALATPVWELRYAGLMALHRLGDTETLHQFTDDKDWLLRSKALSLLSLRR